MRGESVRKFLADDSEADRKAFGRVLKRMLELAGLSQSQLARDLGYGDNQAPISRWIAGVEAAPMARIWAQRTLRCAFLAAVAEESASDGVTGRFVIELPHVKAVGQ